MPNLSPKSLPANPVKSRVRELLMGTAREMGADPRRKKYRADPDWLSANATTYCAACVRARWRRHEHMGRGPGGGQSDRNTRKRDLGCRIDRLVRQEKNENDLPSTLCTVSSRSKSKFTFNVHVPASA